MRCLSLALVLTLAATFYPQKPAHSQDCPYESYAVDCTDNDPLTGYWWQSSIWTPGLITVDTWFTPTPPLVEGKATFYYAGLMKATAEYRGLDLEGYLGGVSLMTCADIGFDVWLRRPGHDWEGPYLSVDCARRGDLYGVIVGRGEVVEVSWATAKRWGMVDPSGKIEAWNIKQVQVSKIDPVYLEHESAVVLSEWFLDVLEYEHFTTAISQPLYEHPRTWRIEGEWKTFEVPQPVIPTPTITPADIPLMLLPEKKYATFTDAEVRESQEEIEMTEIDPGLAAGIVAALSVIVWFFTFVWSGLLKKPKPSENILKAAVVVGAVVLAYVYAPVELPVYAGDPLGFGVAFLMVVVTIFKAAQLFYDFIWSRLLGLLDKGIAFAIGRSTKSYSFLLPRRS